MQPDSDQTKAIRALTRAREDLVAARVAMANQLRAELERFWPGPIGLFNDLDSPISLAFLERYPSPKDAHRLGEKRLQAFLKSCNYNNRNPVAQLLERLRQAPAGRTGEIETATRRQIVLAVVATLQTIGRQIAGFDAQIAGALAAHRDGEIFRSFFLSPNSVICAATLLAEIGDCRARYPHRDAIAADAGQAPVAVESGKRKPRSSAGRATNAFATRWRCWRTAPRCGTHGPKTATPTPERADITTAARCGPSAARSAGSSGVAGRTTPPMTPSNTPQQHIAVTIPSPSGPRPDVLATQQMAGKTLVATPNPSSA